MVLESRKNKEPRDGKVFRFDQRRRGKENRGDSKARKGKKGVPKEEGWRG